MRADLEKMLKDKFSNLYRDIDTFQCDDGWFELIWRLSDIVDHHCNLLPTEIKGQIHAVQVKQKFGELRFYVNHSTPYLSGAVDMAEHMSQTICEQCGNLGIVRSISNYFFCACDIHFEEEKNRRKKT